MSVEQSGPVRPGGATPLGVSASSYGFGAPVPAIGLRPPSENLGRGLTVVPSLGARLTFRDNARRPASVDSETDGSLDMIPGIAIQAATPRVRFNLGYIAQKTSYFRDHSRDRWGNNLGASATVEAIERFFYVDASAAITQQFFSTVGPRFEDTSGDYANRFESRAASVSPYLAGRIGENIPYTIRYNHVWAQSGASSIAVPSSVTQQLIGHVEGPIPESSGWSLDYSQYRVEWENQPTRTDFLRYFGTLYHRISPEVTVSARGGQESNNFSGESKTYNNYGGGFSWRPTRRTSLDALVEHRFFGTGYNGRFAHRHRDISFSIGASRDITFYQQRLFSLPAGDVRLALDAAYQARFPDPVQRAAEVNRTISTLGLPALSGNQLTYFSQRTLLQKQIDAALVWLGTQNTLALNLYSRDLRPIDSQAFALPGEDLVRFSDSKQLGGNLTLVHRLGGTTYVSGRLGRLRSKSRAATLGNAESTQDEFTITLISNVGPRTQLYSGFRVLRLDSSSNSDILERSVFSGFAHTFQ